MTLQRVHEQFVTPLFCFMLPNAAMNDYQWICIAEGNVAYVIVS